MDATDWDEKYAASPHLWSHGPNAVVERLLTPFVPGRALDLACGEGRHALWLADRGWEVDAVDFSATATARAEGDTAQLNRVAAAAGTPPGALPGNRVRWHHADVTEWEPGGAAYDLVLIAYLHLPRTAMRAVLDRAASRVARGGRLLVLGHAVRNLTDGVGGPQDPAVLHDEELYAEAAQWLLVERCEEITREAESGTAIDILLWASR